MNKRLRELMIEAGYAAPELAGRANKLAELIVKECIVALDEADGSVHHSECLLEHFGVEE